MIGFGPDLAPLSLLTESQTYQRPTDAMSETTQPEPMSVYQLRVVVRGISPLIWGGC
jgi:hypothetical protein